MGFLLEFEDAEKVCLFLLDIRHCSFNNFIVNAVSALAAYYFFPKKPAISFEYIHDNQLTIF